jgi:hypothetical protein
MNMKDFPSPESISCNPVSVLDSAWGATVCSSSNEYFPDLVPKEINQVVAECGDHEVRRGNSAGAETHLQRLHVADEYDQGDLTKYRVI